MPKAKTMLDELARVLKARKAAVSRAGRRDDEYLRHPWSSVTDSKSFDSWSDAMDAKEEGKNLVRDLSDRAVMEYDRLMRSNPGRRDMQKALRMMPGELIREHDYFYR